MAQPNYEEAASNCLHFLQNFVDPAEDPHKPKYFKILQEIANREHHAKKLEIELDDVQAFFADGEHGNPDFVEEVESNTLRYTMLFAEAADQAMPAATRHDLPMDVFDMLSQHRRQMDETNQQNEPQAGTGCPPTLLRRFDVYIVPRSKMQPTKLRSVTSRHIGKLVKLRGVVTHVTDVKPLVQVVAYTDPESGYEVYQEVHGRTFRPLSVPPQANEPNVNRQPRPKTLPVMETRGSKFAKFQEARIQEMADEVPEGATPRTISVHLRGEVCRSMKPGDVVTLSGVFLPEPLIGFRAMKAGLLTTTYILAQHVVQMKKSWTFFQPTDTEVAQLASLQQDGDVYGRLARSIAPEIYGHEDVKKALLLLMVGAPTRKFDDGLRLRGDIHVCLMGDPGVAKSQLLKYISRTAPRAVYTTGKGSSGVGLTAAVMRNQVTKELVLEGGALVLADKGICCIDEFDKMEEGDRTAIHEVMEQQTVSIAKAGITTTLNTRTSILAAANPAWGRYDKKRSPADNINLPAALLSRFDILWLILDDHDKDKDERLAKHILAVHKMQPLAPEQGQAQPVPPHLLRAYIARSRQVNTVVPEHVTEHLAITYADMRQNEKGAESASTYTTPRTLLSIIRLAQSLARLRHDSTVAQGDVDEALRLMSQSKASLATEEEAPRRESVVDLVYRLITEYVQRTKATEIPYSKVLELVSTRNVGRDDIVQCVQEYSDLAIWNVEMDQDGLPIVHMPPEHEAFA